MRQNVSLVQLSTSCWLLNDWLVMSRLQAVHLAVDEINTKAKEVDNSDYEPSLEAFSKIVERLTSEFPREFDRYRLDEVVVAAIVPTVCCLKLLILPLTRF